MAQQPGDLGIQPPLGLGAPTPFSGLPRTKNPLELLPGRASSADGLHGLSQQRVPTEAVICDAARKGQSCEGQGSGPGL